MRACPAPTPYSSQARRPVHLWPLSPPTNNPPPRLNQFFCRVQNGRFATVNARKRSVRACPAPTPYSSQARRPVHPWPLSPPTRDPPLPAPKTLKIGGFLPPTPLPLSLCPDPHHSPPPEPSTSRPPPPTPSSVASDQGPPLPGPKKNSKSFFCRVQNRRFATVNPRKRSVRACPAPTPYSSQARRPVHPWPLSPPTRPGTPLSRPQKNAKSKDSRPYHSPPLSPLPPLSPPKRDPPLPAPKKTQNHLSSEPSTHVLALPLPPTPPKPEGQSIPGLCRHRPGTPPSRPTLTPIPSALTPTTPPLSPRPHDPPPQLLPLSPPTRDPPLPAPKKTQNHFFVGFKTDDLQPSTHENAPCVLALPLPPTPPKPEGQSIPGLCRHRPGTLPSKKTQNRRISPPRPYPYPHDPPPQLPTLSPPTRDPPHPGPKKTQNHFFGGVQTRRFATANPRKRSVRACPAPTLYSSQARRPGHPWPLSPPTRDPPLPAPNKLKISFFVRFRTRICNGQPTKTLRACLPCPYPLLLPSPKASPSLATPPPGPKKTQKTEESLCSDLHHSPPLSPRPYDPPPPNSLLCGPRPGTLPAPKKLKISFFVGLTTVNPRKRSVRACPAPTAGFPPPHALTPIPLP